MNIVVVGTGYVGLVTGTCLAELGHAITCVEIDEKKLAKLRAGISPIYEPGLEEMMQKNISAKKLQFTSKLSEALPGSEVVFIAVGTPSDGEGKADLRYVETVARDLGIYLDHYVVVANKSTVPVGTGKMVQALIQEKYAGEFDVVSCPEFLREGTAVEDFFAPDRIVIGSWTQKGSDALVRVFEKLPGKRVLTTVESSEMIKYASNAFLATKISFINEIANICERVGANVDDVAYGMGLDVRIGDKFLVPGLGYGGSCFPKDVRALRQIAGTNGYEFKLLKAVIDVNNDQRRFLVEKVEKLLGTVRGAKIAVLGLAFKKNTDDVRESASLDIIEMLKERGAAVRAYDSKARENAQQVLSGITFSDDVYTCCEGVEAVIIATEWDEFRQIDWKKIRSLVKNPVLIDGRNMLRPKDVEEQGWRYISVGRPHNDRVLSFYSSAA